MLPANAPVPDRFSRRDEAARMFGEDARRFAQYMMQGDPLADALALRLSKGRIGASQALVDRALREGVDRLGVIPGELRALLDEVEQVPDWVDFDRIHHGAVAVQRLGPAAMLILSAWSLMNSYHSGPAVKALMFTGELTTRAPRRLAETGRFVTEVTQVDGLRRFGRGLEITVKVRIMHAQVRRMIHADASVWNASAWGAPINQADMLGTIVELSFLVIEGARKLGFRFTRKEREDIVHLWRYVGHLSGVSPWLLEHLDSYERGWEFSQMIRMVQAGSDDDSVALAAALRDASYQSVSSRFERMMLPVVTRLHNGLVWSFNGDEIARDLKTPNRAWRHARLPIRAVISVLELVRICVPGMSAALSRRRNAAGLARISSMLENREPAFTVGSSTERLLSTTPHRAIE